MSMGNQVEIEYILWFDKPDQDVLTDLTKSIDHKVVCVEHQSEKVCESLFYLTELICIQILDYRNEVFSWDTAYFDLTNPMLLIDRLAALAHVLVILHNVQL